MKRYAGPNDDVVLILPENNFSVVRKVDDEPNTLEFKPHNHDDVYEIVYLLGGDCEFVVEGNAYRLRPGDIVFTRPFELHRILCLSDKTYERIILYIKEEWFDRHDCAEYRGIFENRALGEGSLVPADITNEELRDCMRRAHEYYEEGAYKPADARVTEFLHLLNGSERAEAGAYAKNERIRDIIMYINEHITEELKLEDISKKFFIDKYYLCKSFKKNTGFTVSQYINRKRLLLARELRRGGKTLLQSSLDAGFNSYAHFYKTYVKQNGAPPSSMRG